MKSLKSDDVFVSCIQRCTHFAGATIIYSVASNVMLTVAMKGPVNSISALQLTPSLS